MGAEQHSFGKDAATSLLGWWSDAGVDVAVGEVPFDWLGQAKPAKSMPASPAPKAELPATHAAFVEWLLSGDIAEAGPSRRRLAPSGNPASRLMILADLPDAADIDADAPFAGDMRDVFDKMLAAIGHDRSSVYIATLCPGRPATGRISPESIDGLAEIARHHIALTRVEQLWLMGAAASRAILGMDDSAARGKLHNVNLNGRNVKAIATAHPRLFEGSKARKAAAWAEMQRLIEKDPV
jgi:uracil-DNA glycosylase